MKLIAHKGNTAGPNPELENSPNYILETLANGYECEIDVWYKNENWWLGHDEPKYKVPLSFLKTDGLWLHCKSFEALEQMTQYHSQLNIFWHEDDKYALTTTGYIWTCDKAVGHLSFKTILMLPDVRLSNAYEMINNSYEYSKRKYYWKNYAGVCNDWVSEGRTKL